MLENIPNKCYFCPYLLNINMDKCLLLALTTRSASDTLCWHFAAPLLTKNQLMLTTLHFPSSGKGRLEHNPP